MDDERLYTVSEVAARMRMDPETVRVWLRTGKLRGFRPGGKRLGWRIRESEVRRVVSGGQEGKEAPGDE